MGVYISLLIVVYIVLIIHEKLYKINDSQLEDLEHSKSRKRFSFVSIFLLLGFFSAARDGIGIDYGPYLFHIERIALGYPNYMEPGFKYLSKLVMYFSNDPRTVLILISFMTMYFFVSAIYKLSLNIKMSIFLFLTWGYYFFTFNTARNYLALSIAVYALTYVFEKKYLKFIFWILIAASFHKSALICLPLYIIANRKFNKQTYFFVLISSILLFLFKDQLRAVAFWIYPVYEGSAYDSGAVSFLNILKSLFVLLYGVLYYKKVKKDYKLTTFFNLNTIALVIYTALYWLPEISRIGFYFNIFSILFVPNLTSYIRKEERLVYSLVIYSLSMILFILLMRGFYSSTIQLLPYKTWIFD